MMIYRIQPSYIGGLGRAIKLALTVQFGADQSYGTFEKGLSTTVYLHTNLFTNTVQYKFVYKYCTVQICLQILHGTNLFTNTVRYKFVYKYFTVQICLQILYSTSLFTNTVLYKFDYKY